MDGALLGPPTEEMSADNSVYVSCHYCQRWKLNLKERRRARLPEMDGACNGCQQKKCVCRQQGVDEPPLLSVSGGSFRSQNGYNLDSLKPLPRNHGCHNLMIPN